MKIYNTLTKEKETFTPLADGKVGFYQCGPTVYWTQHIGNLRAMLMADVIRRTLEFSNYNVNFVRNYTDVGHLTSDADHGEDKMEKAAQREDCTPAIIAEKYITQFDTDLEKLNILEPSSAPKATDHIIEMQDMVKTLLEKEFAYATPLAIYFDTSKASDYTRLSGQDLSENLTDAGHGDIHDDEKRNPEDFALWFFKVGSHANAIQTWSSPFESSLIEKGEGFPGWHIECSAMAKKYLGETFDIHMGGVEHISIHHTNEIAQSEAANEKPYVSTWIHNEHLLVDGGKMSKSVGTSFTLDNIIEKGFSPFDLRFFMLQAHYRSKQNFTWEALTAAQTGLKRLYSDIVKLQDSASIIDVSNSQYITQFTDALQDDFNTPRALAIMHETLKSDLSDDDKLSLLYIYDTVFGLNFENPDTAAILEHSSLPEEVLALVNERQEARLNKEWDLSDSLRDTLLDKGYVVKDTSEGQEVSES